MNRLYFMFLVVVLTQMVVGVPLMNRVKRQNPEETNQLAENYLTVEQNNFDDQPNNVADQTYPGNDAANAQPNDMVDQTNTGNDAQNQAPPNQELSAPMVGADNSPYRKYEIAPGYGNQEQPSGQPVIPEPGQVQNDAQGRYVPQVPSEEGPPPVPVESPYQGATQDAPPQTGLESPPGDGVHPNTNIVRQGQNLGGDTNSPYRQYEHVPQSGETAEVPPGYGTPQTQNERNDNSPYVPYVPQSGDTVPVTPSANRMPQNQNENSPYIPYVPQVPQQNVQVPESGQPIQPDSGLGIPGSRDPLQQPIESEFPQNQFVGDINQQYVPPQLPDTGMQPNQPTGDFNQPYTPYVPPQSGEALLPQNQIAGNAGQQYSPYVPPQEPASGRGPPSSGEPLKPEVGLGLPPQGQGMLDGKANSIYRQYGMAPGYENAAEGQPRIQTVLPSSNPIVNVTEKIRPTITTAYVTRTEISDFEWPMSSYDYVNDLYPDTDASDTVVDQSYNLFNGANLNNEVGPEQTDFENSEEPFNPYESVDDPSYDAILQQEIEDYKNGLYAQKQDSPSDRLQPDVYAPWQLDNSQPSSTLNPQATNNFLLYCIPAILLTLVLYIGYTNYNRKPKIVNIPSGNNWRADYRDIEARSKEIEPMLRKAEMY